jgi:hypothetical protein
MITFYFLIAAFVMGAFVGSAIESKEKPDAAQWFALTLLAVCWPFLGYVYWCDWRKKS